MTNFELIVGLIGTLIGSMASLTYWCQMSTRRDDLIAKVPIVSFVWIYLAFGWVIAGSLMFTILMIASAIDSYERWRKP